MAQKSKPGAKPKKALKAPAKAKTKPAPARAKLKTAKAGKPVATNHKSPAKISAKPAKPAKPAKTAKVKPINNGAAKEHEPARPPVRLPRDAKTLAFFDRQKKRLLELRDHFLDQMQSVAQGSLRSRSENNEASAVGQHQADAGSDAYEKDFALSLLSQEQDALYEIEEALKRIEVGTYGVCEMSNKAIPHARLEAIPFARFTVECQQQLEKENRGRRRWDTAPQFMDSAEAFADEEEEAADDDDKKKEKD
jgi:RNA polymerase-binding transcription factor DksA